MKWVVLPVVLFLGLVRVLHAASPAELDLKGTWRLRLDRDGSATGEALSKEEFKERITLPASLTARGFGDEVGPDTPWVGTVNDKAMENPRLAPYLKQDNFKFPFWLQPDKYYRGAAWYQRQVNIPASWKGKRVVLHLERPHWETAVWVDDRPAGGRDSLSVAHEYDLSDLLTPGEHRLTLRIDNSCGRIDVGVNSHSVSDHTQGNWNGVVGEIKLVASDPVWIDHVRVDPDVARSQAKVLVTLGNRTGKPATGTLRLRAALAGGAEVAPVEAAFAIAGESRIQELMLPLGKDMRLWDEFNPGFYQLRVSLHDEAGHMDIHETRFGMREMGTKGTQITVNGRPVFLRGTLECAIFPKTGHPPTDVESWRRIMRICKDHGLNHIRFHSWCPPQAAFVAADEAGMYLQVECASWANFGAVVGSGRPLDQWLYDEGARITRAYGNHPSFVLMAYGNEPAGKNHHAWLAEWCRHWKRVEPRMLHTTGAGWPMLPESNFHSTHKDVRIQAWGGGLNSIINAKPPQTRFDFAEYLTQRGDKPTITHEIGQWCAYPNFEEVAKYDGPLKARNFEVFRELLDQAGMADQARDFLMASGKLQALCYKHDIEAALRTRGFGGFQLLDLHDFPGQGTALVGVLDAFWDSKGYITAEQYRRFCAPTVPLARLDRMIWTDGETVEADVEIAHFGAKDLASAVVAWKLMKPDGKALVSGTFPAQAIQTGQNTDIGRIRAPLAGVTQAVKLVLEISVEGTDARNHWDLWCYPAKIESPEVAGVHLTGELDEPAIATLQKGGKVWWMVSPKRVKSDVAIGFSSIFWNTAWTGGQAPHTLGILCDPGNPALGRFPSDFHSNWQWWDLVTRSATLEMDRLPKRLRPIVQVVPDWFDPKRLGLVFEAKVGKGRLLVSSIELQQDLPQRPVARQLRHSLLHYMAGDAFQPEVEVGLDALQPLVHEGLRNQTDENGY